MYIPQSPATKQLQVLNHTLLVTYLRCICASWVPLFPPPDWTFCQSWFSSSTSWLFQRKLYVCIGINDQRSISIALAWLVAVLFLLFKLIFIQTVWNPWILKWYLSISSWKSCAKVSRSFSLLGSSFCCLLPKAQLHYLVKATAMDKMGFSSLK